MLSRDRNGFNVKTSITKTITPSINSPVCPVFLDAAGEIRLNYPRPVIGLFPDVGTAHVLSRLPGGLGQYLGLTGARLRGNDLLHCGLATHLVPRDR